MPCCFISRLPVPAKVRKCVQKVLPSYMRPTTSSVKRSVVGSVPEAPTPAMRPITSRPSSTSRIPMPQGVRSLPILESTRPAIAVYSLFGLKPTSPVTAVGLPPISKPTRHATSVASSHSVCSLTGTVSRTPSQHSLSTIAEGGSSDAGSVTTAKPLRSALSKSILDLCSCIPSLSPHPFFVVVSLIAAVCHATAH